MIKDQIVAKLEQQFLPTYLTVFNESHLHRVPKDSQTHFKVVIVSAHFIDKRPVARHQAIYQTLADELAGGVHALALHAYTPDEWAAQDAAFPASPACAGVRKAK